MATTYQLVDFKNKRVWNLGTGSWHELPSLFIANLDKWPRESPVWKTPSFKHWAIEVGKALWWYENLRSDMEKVGEAIHFLEYALTVAVRSYAFAAAANFEVELRDDCSDVDGDPEGWEDYFPQVGSRYKDDDESLDPLWWRVEVATFQAAMQIVKALDGEAQSP